MVVQSMTAAVLTGFGDLDALVVRADLPVPLPGAGQVQVRVSAAAVNNTDIWTREGAYGTATDPAARAGWRGPVEFPRIQGGDIAGRISAVGAGVDPGRIGQRVLVDPALYDGAGHPVGLLGSEVDGGFAEYTVVDAERAHDVTGSPLTDEELACLPIAYGTAMGMLERGVVVAGETVVVTGASGGVGLAAVQLAAARGARVLAVTEPAKTALVRAAGAAVTVDRHGDVAAATENADVVLDVVGGEQLGRLIATLAEGGRAVVAGAVAGPVLPFDLRRLYLHNRTLIGSSMHSPEHFVRLTSHARAGDVRPRVAGRYPLADIHRAQREFVGRRHVGKLVLAC